MLETLREAVAAACAPYGFGWREIADHLNMTVTEAGILITRSPHTLTAAIRDILQETHQWENGKAKPIMDSERAAELESAARTHFLKDFDMGMSPDETPAESLIGKEGKLTAFLRAEAAKQKAARAAAKTEAGVSSPTQPKAKTVLTARQEAALFRPNAEADAQWAAAKEAAAARGAARVEQENQRRMKIKRAWDKRKKITPADEEAKTEKKPPLEKPPRMSRRDRRNLLKQEIEEWDRQRKLGLGLTPDDNSRER